jgi:hypothetical protein
LADPPTTTLIPARKASLRAASQARTAALVGLIAGDVDKPGPPWIGAGPPDPAVSMRAVGQPARSPEPGLVHAQHHCGFDARPLRARRRRAAPSATTPRARPRPRTGRGRPRPPPRARPAASWWCASRLACATCSVNDCRAQSRVRHRQRRLRHCTATCPPPHGRSCGRVSTQSFPDVDSVGHAGQRAAPGSSVANGTILTPNGASTTRSTGNPARPNRHDASSLRSTMVRGSPLAAPEHSEDQGVTGRPRSGAPHGSKPQIARKIEEPSTLRHQPRQAGPAHAGPMSTSPIPRCTPPPPRAAARTDRSEPRGVPECFGRPGIDR